MPGAVQDLNDGEQPRQLQRPAPPVRHGRDKRQEQQEQAQMQQDEELWGQRVERELLMESGDEVLEAVEELRDDECWIEMTARAQMMVVVGRYISCGHFVPPRPWPCGGRGRSLRRA